MPNVDNRIVSMTFDNDRFERKLSDTIKSLDDLNKTIENVGKNQQFDQINAAANRFDTSHMASAIENISSKFSALGAVGFTTIQHLTDGVLGFVDHMAEVGKQNILEPILGGGKQRAQNIEQAQFMFRGLGIDVQKAMDSSKAAVLGTAYSLDAAAKVAAQFGASGIKVGNQMTGALRGVAGAAALTGSSFQEIGDIFAQSAASGKVNTLDLEQFSTRGLNAAAAIAPILGKTEAQVRDMASHGTLDFATFAGAMDKAFGKHATEANQTFAGSLANLHAAMSRMGEALLAPRLNQERDIFNALTPVVDNFTAAMKPLFKVLNDIGQVGTDKIIKFLKGLDFKPISDGFKIIADGVKIIFTSVEKVSEDIKATFHNFFPASTTSTFLTFANAFHAFAEFLTPSSNALTIISGIVGVLVSTFKVAWTIVKELLITFKELIAPLRGTGDGTADLVDKLTGLIIHFNTLLVQGGLIHDFFVRVREVLSEVIVFIAGIIVTIVNLAKSIADFFSGGGSINDGETAVSTAFGRVGQRADQISDLFQRMQDRMSGFKDVLDKTFNVISTWFKELGSKIAAAFKPGDFDSAVDLVNVGLLGGIVVILKKFLDHGLKLDFNAGLFDKIKESFNELTKTLKAMQTEVKAEALEKIAISVGIIAASLVVLSLIDSAKLTKALVAITVSFGELIGAMTAMDRLIGSTGSAAKLDLLGAALILMATSVTILAGALAILSAISPENLAKGMTAIAVGLALLVGTGKILADNVGGFALASVAMIAMSTALVILAGAMLIFATMSWEGIAKGLAAVAGGLILISIAMNLMPATSVLSGIGFVAVAIGLSILAGALKILATISWEGIGKGLLAVAGLLAIITIAVNNMPSLLLPLIGIGLERIAKAIVIMSAAVIALGLMKIETLAKGLGALAIMLGILVLAMHGMESALLGAVTMVIVAGALTILAGVIEALGHMKIEQIAIALGAIVAVILVLAGTAVLLQAAVGPMILLGVALGTLGAAFVLLGGGLFLMAKALEVLAQTGAEGLKVLGLFGSALIHSLIQGITDNAKDLLNAIPLLIRLVQAILDQLLETIIKLAPKIAQALIALFTNGLKALREIYPQLIETGLFLLLKLLDGLAQNIGPIATAALQIITNFINAIADNIQFVIDAGVNLITQYLIGIASAIDQIISTAVFILTTFITELGNHIDDIVTAGANFLINFIAGIANNILKVAETVTQIIDEFIIQMGIHAIDIANTGTNMLITFLFAITSDVVRIANAITDLITTLIIALGNDGGRIAQAGADALSKFLGGLGGDAKIIGQAVSKLIGDIVDAMVTVLNNIPDQLKRLADAFIGFINGIADAISQESKPLGEAMAHLAESLISGFADAFKAALKKFVKDQFPSQLQGVIDTAIGIFDSHSPSRVFMKIGNDVADGLAIGISSNMGNSVDAVNTGSKLIISSMQESLTNVADVLSNTSEFNPTITPVLDLTKVQTEAGRINGMMLATISPDASLGQARDISAKQAAIDAARVSTPEQTSVPSLEFNQTINAPEPLSANDIYRNTKSQIALAKEELGIS